MEIKDGCYVHVYDRGHDKSPKPKGAVYVGDLPEAWDERMSIQFIEYDDNGKPVTGGREHRERMSTPDLLPLFIKIFHERYKSDYYYVKFFHVFIDHHFVDGISDDDLISTDCESGEHVVLKREGIISWKLLLDDALRISAGRQKPLKLAIELANNIRNVSGRSSDNVPNVFQVESAQADFSSQIQATHNVPISE